MRISNEEKRMTRKTAIYLQDEFPIILGRNDPTLKSLVESACAEFVHAPDSVRMIINYEW